MKILFIGSRLFDDIDYYIKEKNIESVITESNEEALNLDLADKYFIVSRGMTEPSKIAIREKVGAVVPLIGIDTPLKDVAIMKEELESKYNIPVIASNSYAIDISSDKFKTKSFFKSINVNFPKFKILNKYNLDNLEFPLVLKQSEGQGGKDIKIAISNEDVIEYLNNFGTALSEEFIEGSEISIEVLGFNGEYVPLTPIYKGETTLEGIHPLNKVKYGPCDIAGLDNNIIKDIAYKIAKTLDSDGIIEIDMIYSKVNSKLYSIEINTRPNGTRYLTEATCGVNTLLKLVDMACGDFNPRKIEKEIKSYCSTEIPIGVYSGPSPNEPIKSFKNNDFVVHGPKNHERITIRADSKEELKKLTKMLGN
jgi:carbamoylphosphate synthase large subunit